jgi:hypothetical protein
MKSKFICCYLEENYGMSVYDSKEELLENLGDVFGVETFEELIVRVQDIYEIIEVKGDFELKFIVDNGLGLS